MSHFPQLPVVDALADKARTLLEHDDLSEVAILAVQHLLETTGSLFESLIRIGFSPRQIFVLGKSYSTIPSVRARLTELGINVLQAPCTGDYRGDMQSGCSELWNVFETRARHRTRKVIILDEGGFCVRSLRLMTSPVSVVAIEQTKSGMHYLGSGGAYCPVILVASCAVKKFLEPALIAEEIVTATTVQESSGERRPRYGVLGVGNIGKALIELLLRNGQVVTAFDHNESKLKRIPDHASLTKYYDRDEFLKGSDIIFGCTGRDALSKTSLPAIGQGRVVAFVSCSSGDFEFLSLLNRARGSQGDMNSPFDDVHIAIGRSTCVIRNGGFPINFTRRAELTAPTDIQLTRGLLFGAILQAVASSRLPSFAGGEMLSPELQKFIAGSWLRVSGRACDDRFQTIVEKLTDTQWLSYQSNGRDRKPFQSVGAEFWR